MVVFIVEVFVWHFSDGKMKLDYCADFVTNHCILLNFWY